MNTDNITKVATAVAYSSKRDKFLLTKRTQSTDIHPGKWDFPGGHIRKQDFNEGSTDDEIFSEYEEPRKAALRELEEETNLRGQVIRTGDSFSLDTVDGKFKIYPFLILVEGEPELSEEHSDYEWIDPDDLSDFETVKGLDTDLDKLDVL